MNFLKSLPLKIVFFGQFHALKIKRPTYKIKSQDKYY